MRKKDLSIKEQRVNDLLENIKGKIAYRYDYTAIDLVYPDGTMHDTLTAGLTKREAYQILDAIEAILRIEKRR